MADALAEKVPANIVMPNFLFGTLYHQSAVDLNVSVILLSIPFKP